jgi:hypothetical protein
MAHVAATFLDRVHHVVGLELATTRPHLHKLCFVAVDHDRGSPHLTTGAGTRNRST